MTPTGMRWLSAAAIVCCWLGSAQGQVPLNRSPLESVTTAGTGVADGAEPWAVTVNPASLRDLRGYTFGFRHSELLPEIPWAGRGSGLYFATPLPYLRAIKVGAGLELLRPHDDLPMLGKLTLSVAYVPTWWAAVGLSYGHSFSSRSARSYGGLDTIGVGLHLRPNRRLAFGVMLHDLNAPKPAAPSSLPEVARSYEFETLLQPLGDSRWDIGLGVRVGEGYSEVSPRLRLWVRPTAGLGIGIDGSSVIIPDGAVTVDWRIGVGLSLDFARVGGQVFQFFGLGRQDPVRYHGGSVALRVSSERYASLWAGPKSVLRLNLGEWSGRGLLRLLLTLRELKTDRHIEGVLVVVNGVSGGWGKAFELRQALLELRKSGKRVIAYAADLSTREYYIASAADEILLDPAGLVRLSGIAQATTHYREALDRLGIRADLVRIGNYKASPESFTRDGPSEPTRQQRQALVDDIFQRVLAEIADSRRLPVSEVEKLVERGQHIPMAAKTVRLVDAIAAQDDVEARLSQIFGSNLRVESLPSAERPRSSRPHGVAVIEVVGDLTDGTSQTVPYVGFQTVGAQTLSAALEEASNNPQIEAVVLRIDSPGGSALAADVLSRQVKQLGQRKPVLCSFGDIAASGGYYLSAPCREIFADPLTITGSIGIFGGKVDVSALLGRIGVERARYVHGNHADMESPYRAYSEEERTLLLERLQAGYDRFLEVVSSGRHFSRKELEPLAEGRVWSGGQAVARRLVDRLGGLADAVHRARELAELHPQRDAAVFFLPERPRSLLGELLDVAGGLVSEGTAELPRPLSELLRLIPPSVWALFYDGDSVLMRLEDEPIRQ